MAAVWSAACLALSTPCLSAEQRAPCASQTDPVERLACYDRQFPVLPATTAAEQAEARRDEPVVRGSAGSVLTRFWELDHASSQRKFIVKTYLPNYLLPLHYTTRINRHPSSPTQGDGPATPHYSAAEAKFQVSLRAKVADDFVLPGANLWLAFTQRSMWQVWNHEDSAPFRSTDYQPEAVYVVPIAHHLSLLPEGWQWRLLQVGVAHQSNGQAAPLSRGWNRLYFGTAFDHEEVALQLRVNRRLAERGDDDNPDLTRYLGQGEVALSWLPGRSTATMTWRTGARLFHRGSMQLEWTHPVEHDQPSGLRWYAQLFTGYGETLLDYNHRQTSMGLGLALFQF